MNANATLSKWFASRRFFRRGILLSAIALSGGALYLPRPLFILIFFVLTTAICFNKPPLIRRAHYYIYAWIVITACLTLLRPTTHEAIATTVKLVAFFTGLALVNLYRTEREAFAEDFSWLVHPMCYQALGTVLLKIIAPGIFFTLVVDGATTKTLLLIFNYHDTLGDDPLFVRPDGIFWEPGVFQIYLNTFVYISLFVKRNAKLALLGSAAVLSTQSTTGIVILGTQLAIFALKSVDLKSRHKLLRGSLVALVIAPIFIYVAHENISEKLFGQTKGSAVTREFDLLTGLLITQAHPLTGIGFSKENYITAAATYGFAGSEFGADYFSERQSTSNGLVQAFFSIGIPLGSVLVLGLLRQRFLPNNRLVFFILALSLIGEALMFTPIFLALSFSGLARRPPSSKHRSHKPRVVAPT